MISKSKVNKYFLEVFISESQEALFKNLSFYQELDNYTLNPVWFGCLILQFISMLFLGYKLKGKKILSPLQVCFPVF